MIRILRASQRPPGGVGFDGRRDSSSPGPALGLTNRKTGNDCSMSVVASDAHSCRTSKWYNPSKRMVELNAVLDSFRIDERGQSWMI